LDLIEAQRVAAAMACRGEGNRRGFAAGIEVEDVADFNRRLNRLIAKAI